MIHAKDATKTRRLLWRHLTSLKTKLNNTPWVLMGHFNCIRTPEERLGTEEGDDRAMEEFNQFIVDMDTEEFQGKGYYYAWCNNRENGD